MAIVYLPRKPFDEPDVVRCHYNVWFGWFYSGHSGFHPHFFENKREKKDKTYNLEIKIKEK